MKIAYVVHDLNKKTGHARYTYELIDNLCARHTIHIFSTSIEGVDKKNFVFHKIPVIRFPALLKICMFLVISFPLIWLAHRKEKFDIIHYQGACAYPLKPAVITAHICSAEFLKIYKNFGNQKAVIRWLYRYIYTYLNTMVEKKFFNVASVIKIIAPSELAKRHLIKNYNLRPWNIKRIYEGVNLNEFSKDKNSMYTNGVRQKLNISDSDFVILFIGDYIIKGLEVAIRAIKDFDCKLIVIGKGDKNHFRDLAKKENVLNKIIFLGWQKSISRYFTIADALLIPTRCDPFGLISLEALASEAPCIISKQAGASELLHDRKNAILLDYPFNYVQIRHAINQLIVNSDFKQNLAAGGKKIASAHTWAKVARETELVYESLVIRQGCNLQSTF